MTELQKQRKKPDNFNEVLSAFKQSGVDRLVRLELAEMAEGGNPKGGDPNPDFKGMREEYYSDWEDQDFADLLEELGHPLLPKQTESRKKPDNFNEVVNLLRSRIGDRLVRLELAEMAEGGNPRGGDPNPDFKGMREEYYPSWEDQDFADLLEELGHPLQTD